MKGREAEEEEKLSVILMTSTATPGNNITGRSRKVNRNKNKTTEIPSITTTGKTNIQTKSGLQMRLAWITLMKQQCQDLASFPNPL